MLFYYAYEAALHGGHPLVIGDEIGDRLLSFKIKKLQFFGYKLNNY